MLSDEAAVPREHQNTHWFSHAHQKPATFAAAGLTIEASLQAPIMEHLARPSVPSRLPRDGAADGPT